MSQNKSKFIYSQSKECDFGTFSDQIPLYLIKCPKLGKTQPSNLSKMSGQIMN